MLSDKADRWVLMSDNDQCRGKEKNRRGIALLAKCAIVINSDIIFIGNWDVDAVEGSLSVIKNIVTKSERCL